MSATLRFSTGKSANTANVHKSIETMAATNTHQIGQQWQKRDVELLMVFIFFFFRSLQMTKDTFQSRTTKCLTVGQSQSFHCSFTFLWASLKSLIVLCPEGYVSDSTEFFEKLILYRLHVCMHKQKVTKNVHGKH